MAYLVQIDQLFAQVYANLVAIRTPYGYLPLVPAGLSNFQIGGEFAVAAQVYPRIVIVPTGEDYDYSQPMPVAQAPTVAKLPRRTSYRVWLNFDAHIWGEPDPSLRPNPDPTPTVKPYLPNPTVGFNATIELRRQFVDAICMSLGSAAQAWQPLSATYPERNETNNRAGRLLVLSFRIASTNANEVYTIKPYSVTQGDGGVTGAVTVQYEAPGSTIPEPQGTIIVPPPDPNAPE